MGQEEKTLTKVQMSNKKKRQHLISICQNYLETSKSIMQYYKEVADTRNGKLSCTRSIKSIDNAIVHLRQIKHTEILEYIYSTFVGNNAVAYAISGSIVISKELNGYDTDDGVKELIEMVSKRKKEQEDKFNEKIKQKEIVDKAKAEGKKVEMVWDKDTKTVKPMIIQEKPNA